MQAAAMSLHPISTTIYATSLPKGISRMVRKVIRGYRNDKCLWKMMHTRKEGPQQKNDEIFVIP
jgi:hypothetical protein